MNKPLVHAVNVGKSFGKNEVLKGIDLDVHPGEVVVLLGPSGSGKTTFLRCINQLETIDGGRIWVDGDLMGYADKGGQLHRLTDKQIARLKAVFASDEHVEVEATWGVYQRIVAAYRHPDRAAAVARVAFGRPRAGVGCPASPGPGLPRTGPRLRGG